MGENPKLVVTTLDLTAALWPALEKLFGSNGACGGCWCIEIAEGYPVKPRSDAPIPAAFAWTGTRSLFDAAGFRVTGNEGGAKERMRKTL